MVYIVYLFIWTFSEYKKKHCFCKHIGILQYQYFTAPQYLPPVDILAEFYLEIHWWIINDNLASFVCPIWATWCCVMVDTAVFVCLLLIHSFYFGLKWCTNGETDSPVHICQSIKHSIIIHVHPSDGSFRCLSIGRSSNSFIHSSSIIHPSIISATHLFTYLSVKHVIRTCLLLKASLPLICC